MFKNRQECTYVGFSPVDRARAKTICKLLHRAGYHVLPTEHDVTKLAQHERNVKRLEASDFVITIVSPEALNSPFIWREVAMANTLKLPLVPVVVEPLGYELPLVGAFDATVRDEHFYAEALLSRLRKSRMSKAQHARKTSTQLHRELEKRETRRTQAVQSVEAKRVKTNQAPLRIGLALATIVIAVLGLAAQVAL